MTAETSIDVREVIFVNQRCEKDYRLLPRLVLETADGYVDALQNGRKLTGGISTPLVNDRSLAGVSELRLPFDGDAFRIYVWLGCEYAIFILDAGSKKSATGQEIPKWQKDRLVERLKIAKKESERLGPELWLSFNQRAQRRNQHQERSNHHV